MPDYKRIVNRMTMTLFTVYVITSLAWGVVAEKEPLTLNEDDQPSQQEYAIIVDENDGFLDLDIHTGLEDIQQELSLIPTDLKVVTGEADLLSSEDASGSVNGPIEIPDSDEHLVNHDALLRGYLENAVSMKNKLKANNRARAGRNGLSEDSLGGTVRLYDLLESSIKAVAQGKQSTTVFRFSARKTGASWWTAKALQLEDLNETKALEQTILRQEGIDPDRLRWALWADFPYELYWLDQAAAPVFDVELQFRQGKGEAEEVRLSQVQYSMPVASDFAKDTYLVNRIPKRVTRAATKIKRIIKKFSKLDDYDKLAAYADMICRLAVYEEDMESSGGEIESLIAVFDQENSTNVAGAGYAKAFKYLCDRSTFKGEVACEMMRGRVFGDRHVWNVVSMPDGRCYLVDLSAGDEGRKCNKALFMKGCVGKPGYPYVCHNRQYNLDRDDTSNVFGPDSPWLKLSNGDYGEDYEVIVTAKNGRLTANPAVADPGKTVKLMVQPATGCKPATPEVKWGNYTIALKSVDENTWSFKMPCGVVSADVVFEPKHRSWHSINGTGQRLGGAVTAKVDGKNVSVARKGTQVALVVQPDKGYLAQKPKLTHSSGKIALKKIGKNTWMFTMPDEEVEITDPFVVDDSWQNLQEAINEAKDGSTIALTKNVTGGICDAGLIVPANKRIKLDLAGHALDRGLEVASVNGCAISVFGELTVTDSSANKRGKITGGYNIDDGGAIVVESHGALVLKEGKLKGNRSAGNGGAVHVKPEGSFRMKGGAISKNTSQGNGGGISVDQGALILNGGDVSGNSSKRKGGGLYSEQGSFAMNKGSIVGNVAAKRGGGAYFQNCAIALSGSPVISSNKSTLSGVEKPNNVWIGKQDTIGIEGPLSQAAHVGLNCECHVFTKGLGSDGNIDAFFSDSSLLVIERSLDASEAQIAVRMDNDGASDIQAWTGPFDHIAYSGFLDVFGTHMNSAEQYELSCSDEYDFDKIKGDLRLTSDRKIVMCHDPGFTLNENGRIVDFNPFNNILIHDLNYQQCMSLQYEKTYEGHYMRVCDFETFLKICSSHNKTAFITIRDEYISELVEEMIPLIYKYGMQNKCIINSFTLNSLKAVRSYDASMPLSWVVNNNVLTTAIIDKAYSMGNCIVTLHCFGVPDGGINKIASYEYEILYAQGKGVPLYTAVMDNASIEDRLRQFGIRGGQFNVKVYASN